MLCKLTGRLTTLAMLLMKRLPMISSDLPQAHSERKTASAKVQFLIDIHTRSKAFQVKDKF